MATRAIGGLRISSERLFFGGMAATMLLSVFIGFAPSYFLRPIYGAPPAMLPMTPLVHLHGLVFSGWMLLLTAQAGLVSAQRTDIHRKLGVAGLGFAVAMIVLGTLTALHGIHRASGPPIVPPLSWAAVPLLSVPAFGGLIVAALWNRRRPQTHKRLMLLATASMMGAAFGRMPAFQGLLGIVLMPNLFIVAIIVWECRNAAADSPRDDLGRADRLHCDYGADLRLENRGVAVICALGFSFGRVNHTLSDEPSLWSDEPRNEFTDLIASITILCCNSPTLTKGWVAFFASNRN